MVPAIDKEDGPRGVGAHRDHERSLGSELHRFVRRNWMTPVRLFGLERGLGIEPRGTQRRDPARDDRHAGEHDTHGPEHR